MSDLERRLTKLEGANGDDWLGTRGLRTLRVVNGTDGQVVKDEGGQLLTLSEAERIPLPRGHRMVIEQIVPNRPSAQEGAGT